VQQRKGRNVSVYLKTKPHTHPKEGGLTTPIQRKREKCWNFKMVTVGGKGARNALEEIDVAKFG